MWIFPSESAVWKNTDDGGISVRYGFWKKKKRRVFWWGYFIKSEILLMKDISPTGFFWKKEYFEWGYLIENWL